MLECLLRLQSDLTVATSIANKTNLRHSRSPFFSHEEMIIDSTEYLVKLQSLVNKTNTFVEKRNAKS